MTLHTDIAKASVAASVTVGSYLAQGIEQVPAWIREFGLPLVMLAGAVAAVVFLYKELKAERAARIADRDAFIAMQIKDREKTDALREAQLKATLEQTTEFRELRRELTRDQR